MTNDECVICNAPYHTGRDDNGNTEKLSRAKHLTHCSKRVEQAIKAKKRSAVLEAHEARLSTTSPSGAVKHMMAVK